MADQGLQTLNQDRSLTQRYFWLWIALAFIVGLVPGIVGLVWYRSTATAYQDTLVQRRNAMAAENTQLRADVAKLESEVASAQAGATDASSGGGSGGSGDTSTGPVPTPKPGQIAFVSRSATPSPASPGATIVLSTTIAGKATDAYMEVKSPDGSFSKIYKLIKAKTNGDAVTWSRTDAVAPKAAGEYIIFSWAFVGSAKSTMPGAGSLTVK